MIFVSRILFSLFYTNPLHDGDDLPPHGHWDDDDAPEHDGGGDIILGGDDDEDEPQPPPGMSKMQAVQWKRAQAKEKEAAADAAALQDAGASDDSALDAARRSKSVSRMTVKSPTSKTSLKPHLIALLKKPSNTNYRSLIVTLIAGISPMTLKPLSKATLTNSVIMQVQS